MSNQYTKISYSKEEIDNIIKDYQNGVSLFKLRVIYKRKKENENTNCVDYNGHSNKKMYTKNLAFKDNTNTFL